MMGLTMSQRQALTKTIATRYKRASRLEKGAILDELCATTGWHRNHARRALGRAPQIPVSGSSTDSKPSDRQKGTPIKVLGSEVA